MRLGESKVRDEQPVMQVCHRVELRLPTETWLEEPALGRVEQPPGLHAWRLTTHCTDDINALYNLCSLCWLLPWNVVEMQ